MAKIKVDMTNVEDGFPVVPEGDYICKVAKIELKTSEKTGGKYLSWTFLIGTGEEKGKKLFTNTSLKPEALFNLRNVISSCGVAVPKSVMEIDTDQLVGRIVGVTVVHGEWKGKTKAEISETWVAVKNASTGKYGKATATVTATPAASTKTKAAPKEEIVDVEDDDDDDEKVPFTPDGQDDDGIEEIEI